MDPLNPLFSDPKRLGEAIRRARLHVPMSQGELAEELGTTRQRISRLELGKEPRKRPRKPAERRAIAIAVAEITKAPRALLGLSEPESSEVDQLRKELLDEIGVVKTKLLGEIERVRSAQASQQPSQEHNRED